MKNFVHAILVLLMISCGSKPEVIDDFGDASFHLVDQDSNAVVFPDDFEGDYVVIGFIYTNCPDICGMITQNLGAIQKELNYPEDMKFVAMTFDPERDSPSVLKAYAKPFGLDEDMTFLTGDTTQVFTMLDSARVRTQVSLRRTTDSGKELYFYNHSDKIMVLNKDAEIVLEYGGSMTKPKMIAEDIRKIR
ncbi:MAG: SCO family protein [Balneolaceae bacterium]|nr:SCO family protein [Balneolaceae bacterium]